MAERFAEGLATVEELAPVLGYRWRPYELVEEVLVRRVNPEAGIDERMLTTLFRCVFGDPRRPLPSLPSSVLAWNDGCVVKLATATYEKRSLPGGTLDNSRLGVLADALEEAGCHDEDILAHLRGPGPHVRGCWPVDLVLAKS